MSDSDMPAPGAWPDMPAPGARPDMPAPGRPAPSTPLVVSGLAFAASAFLLATCQVELPTAAREELVKSGVAVEVLVPFADFVASASVFGGYGRASGLGGGFIAHEFGSDVDENGAEVPGLEAATLVRFGRYPSSVSVVDTAGTNRLDTAITFHAGGVLVRLDTVSSVAAGPVDLVAHLVTEEWDPVSAGWDYAVDTVDNRVAWSTPGGGPGDEIAVGVWDPAAGDSVELMLDSALVVAWADSTAIRDVRITATTPGVRLRVSSVVVQLQTIPSIRPDTLLRIGLGATGATFIYDPLPSPPLGALRVGGAPSWRTVLNLDIPRSLSGYPDLCRQLDCPVDLRADHVSYAGLQLTTAPAAAAFALSDSLALDVRMVTAPRFLPKSPLGPSSLAVTGGAAVAPELYRPEAGQVFELPITEHVRDQLRGETAFGDPVSSTLALMTVFEPLSIEYASFAGRNSATPPMLRLILNFSRGN